MLEKKELYIFCTPNGLSDIIDILQVINLKCTSEVIEFLNFGLIKLA